MWGSDYPNDGPTLSPEWTLHRHPGRTLGYVVHVWPLSLAATHHQPLPTVTPLSIPSLPAADAVAVTTAAPAAATTTTYVPHFRSPRIPNPTRSAAAKKEGGKDRSQGVESQNGESLRDIFCYFFLLIIRLLILLFV